MSNEELFFRAVEYIKVLHNEYLRRRQKKVLYAYFKQATVGTLEEARKAKAVETRKPGLLHPRKRAKWKAWRKLGNMPKEEAMTLYLRTVDGINPQWKNVIGLEQSSTSPVPSSADTLFAAIAAGKEASSSSEESDSDEHVTPSTTPTLPKSAFEDPASPPSPSHTTRAVSSDSTLTVPSRGSDSSSSAAGVGDATPLSAHTSSARDEDEEESKSEFEPDSATASCASPNMAVSSPVAADAVDPEADDVHETYRECDPAYGRDYVIHANGGLLYTNKEELKRQKGIITHMLKSLGANLSQGKSIMNVSLPVNIFEPRSLLHRFTSNWLFAPIFLRRAADTSDPLERFKNVLAFAVSGLHRCTTQKKPFNPILGETLQARLPDGSEVYCEQTSHHPPISHFQLFDVQKKYQIYGYYECSAATKVNSVKGDQYGPTVVAFEDGGRLNLTYPSVYVKGTVFGDRMFQWGGVLSVKDEQNDLYCELVFNPDEKGGLVGLFSRSVGVDKVRGTINRGKEAVCRVEGSWLEKLEIDGQVIWEIAPNSRSWRIEPVENPLLSDTNVREDLYYLRRNEIKTSQDWKEKLEILQRQDRKLRKDGATRRKKSEKSN